MKPAFSARHWRLINLIDAHWQRHGYGPSTRDLVAALEGRGCLNAVADMLRLMERRGLVTYQPGKARTLRVVDHWRAPGLQLEKPI